MALSANRKLLRRNADVARRYSALVSNTTKPYQDSFVGINATGFVLPQADSTAIQPGGIAVSECDTGDGSTVYCEYETNLEVFVPTANHHANVVATMVRNTAMYATDDGDITNATSLGSQVGVMTEFTSTGIWILLGGAINANAAT